MTEAERATAAGGRQPERPSREPVETEGVDRGERVGTRRTRDPERPRDEGPAHVAQEARVLGDALDELTDHGDHVEVLTHPEHVDHAAQHHPQCPAGTPPRTGALDPMPVARGSRATSRPLTVSSGPLWVRAPRVGRGDSTSAQLEGTAAGPARGRRPGGFGPSPGRRRRPDAPTGRARRGSRPPGTRGPRQPVPGRARPAG